MNDETWIRELARAAKDEEEAERAELAGTWDRLSAGELSDTEVAELERRGETSPEAREAFEAFRPLGPEFKARTMAAVRERLAGGGDTSSSEEAAKAAARALAPITPITPIAPEPPRFAPRPFRPQPPPRSWARRHGGWIAATAAAASLIFFIHPPGAPLPPFPEYDHALRGGVASYRGGVEEAPSGGKEATSGIQIFRQGSQLDLILTPHTAVGRAVAAECVLMRERELRSCDENVHQPGQGAVRVTGTIGEDLRLEAGDWTLCAAVGWSRELPRQEEVCSGVDEDGQPPRNWRTWKYQLRIE